MWAAKPTRPSIGDVRLNAETPHSSYRTPKIDLLVNYKNPGASEDLIIPINLVCNTPEEDLVANIKANISDRERGWIAASPAHESTAVLCGSGFSLGEHLDVIRALQQGGATVYAMNGAASFLSDNGILADFQVIADARERTADLVGPAANHIFASQVHSACFEKAPGAYLMHVNFYTDHNEFLKIVDGYGPDEFALIGSHGSVGNVAMSLAYAMGFRDLRVFGYDSSFRDDKGHAFDQPMNATEPVCDIEYDGRRYRMTFTMKSQADVFPRLAYELEDMGATVHVYGNGYLQARWFGERAKSLEDREADKYREMWSHAEYRNLIPSLGHVAPAIVELGLRAGDTLVDFGCGTARATKEFETAGLTVLGIDIAPNALEREINFVHASLWQDGIVPVCRAFDAHWGFCVDVMEHIPPEKVDAVLSNISKSVSRGAYFCVDYVRDEMGILIGQPLHLTVRSPEWWLAKMQEHFADVVPLPGGVFVCRKSRQGNE